MKVKTKSSDEWKIITSAISTLVDEATFDADVEGISFRGMDPSHVALIDIHWPNSAFEIYECDSAVKFGVRIDEFSKVVKRADRKDPVEVSLTDDSSMLVKIQGNYKREYKMRLIDAIESSTPLPKLNLTSKVVLTASAFDKILNDIQVISEYVTIKTSEKEVEFLGRGDSGEVTIALSKDSEGIESLEVKEPGQSTYSLDYLSKMSKAINSAGGSVIAEFSTKMPLRLEFTVSNIGRIHYFLAPRVQD